MNDFKLQLMEKEVCNSLGELERIFPPERYELTFLARYTKADLDDADVLVTSDGFKEICTAVERRARVKNGIKLPTVRGLYDVALKRSQELAKCEWSAAGILEHVQALAELGVFHATIPVRMSEEAGEKLMDELEGLGLECCYGWWADDDDERVVYTEFDVCLRDPDKVAEEREAFQARLREEGQ